MPRGQPRGPKPRGLAEQAWDYRLVRESSQQCRPNGLPLDPDYELVSGVSGARAEPPFLTFWEIPAPSTAKTRKHVGWRGVRKPPQNHPTHDHLRPLIISGTKVRNTACNTVINSMLFPSDVAGQKRINTHIRSGHTSTQQRFDAVSMCNRAAATSGSSSSAVDIPTNNAKLTGQASVGWGRMTVLVPSFVRSLAQPPFTKRKIAILVIVASVFLSTAFFASLYKFHGGFRRTVQFWKGMGPLVMKYKLLKFKATKWDQLGEDDDEYKRRITAYRQKSAPQLVDLILSLGGIYTKIAQVMSTIGQGLLPDEYIEALRPLQDGVPARNFDEISTIIERSTKQKMDELFVEFDEKPIGAASIGQAHKARLRSNGETVVVKVQYPEVAELFEADLSNLEMATRLFAPENMEVAKALRKRHENELDFEIEAENLRQCTEDMQEYGLEPTLVRIPRVYNVYGRKVLIMEYLKGVSLGDAIEEEQNRVAKALGKKDARELTRAIQKNEGAHGEWRRRWVGWYENARWKAGEDAQRIWPRCKYDASVLCRCSRSS